MTANRTKTSGFISALNLASFGFESLPNIYALFEN